jgi:ABC-type nitrate/sulfonate/bicarbonate transport system permease component
MRITKTSTLAHPTKVWKPTTTKTPPGACNRAIGDHLTLGEYAGSAIMGAGLGAVSGLPLGNLAAGARIGAATLTTLNGLLDIKAREHSDFPTRRRSKSFGLDLR